MPFKLRLFNIGILVENAFLNKTNIGVLLKLPLKIIAFNKGACFLIVSHLTKYFLYNGNLAISILKKKSINALLALI